MRYISARQMIFDAYHTRKGDSPAAAYFDRAQKLGDAVGNNGAKLRSLIAEHKRNMRALSHAGPFDENLDQLKMAVRRTEKRLSEIRTALEDTTKSSNEGRLPDNDWKIVHGLEAGAVMSRVESLPPHLAALARYCFGPFTRDELDEDRETVELALYRQLLADGIRLPGQGKGRPTAQQLETLRYLCAAALYHHSETTWPYRRAGLPTPQAVQRWLIEERGTRMDVHRWSRLGRSCWGDIWRSSLERIDAWEAAALGPIASLTAPSCAA
ncbi:MULTISPECIES: hypothetical protein [Halomonas]|uniref:hypothetical protein n=1 Tax=Halomonas TaxID=2745 RepID=UPI001C94481D|nr:MULTISPECIES: hypothetical protein [Halomonas]MBY6208748.1 hypothetical protein [Halomonas sp. DP3Y7-2]MBY6227218.1 hypothetical protein [Halomonas sp. DP3Y7-1]MCA0915032.1 hypothetical protein [Halomonas denitrificans]